MLTAKQHQLLLFIHDRLEKSGVSPSFDEMKQALDLKSKSGIHRLITALEERGFIRRLPNKARALEIVRLPETVANRGEPKDQVSADVVPFARRPAPIAASELVEIPLHGRIAAGTPIEALESVDSHISLPPDMLRGGGRHFALTVDGDSMVDAGILDGDMVVIESGDTARDGEIVVALVDNEEATLKTLRRAGAQVDLVPANSAHQVQRLDARRVKIQGRMVGLFRRY